MPHASPLRACALWLCVLCASACAHAPAPAPSQAGAGAQATQPEDGGAYTVVLPRPLRPGEQLLLEVELGTAGAGMQVVLRTRDGRLVGTVSPHGLRHGAAAGTYLLPVPAALLQDIAGTTRWPLQVRIESSAAAPRAADAQTVRAIRAVIAPD